MNKLQLIAGIEKLNLTEKEFLKKIGKKPYVLGRYKSEDKIPRIYEAELEIMVLRDKYGVFENMKIRSEG